MPAVEELRGEKRFDQVGNRRPASAVRKGCRLRLCRRHDCLSMVDQPVRIQRIGAQFDLLEGERYAGLADPLRRRAARFGQLLWPAELPFQEGPVGFARFGRVRVEEEGPPTDRYFAVRLLGAPQFQRRSRWRLPMKHQGQTTSETTSIVSFMV
jgi:hypothetical protein